MAERSTSAWREHAAGAPRKRQQTVEQLAHVATGDANPLQVAPSVRTDGRPQVLLEGLGESAHRSQRRAQVVRHGVGEGVELLVCGGQLGGPTFDPVLEVGIEPANLLFGLPLHGDVLGEDDDPSHRSVGNLPGAHFSANPLDRGVGALEAVGVATRGLPDKSSSVNLAQPVGDLGKDVVVRPAGERGLAVRVVDAPGSTRGESAHLPVEDGEGCRRVLDEERESLLALAPGGEGSLGAGPRRIGDPHLVEGGRMGSTLLGDHGSLCFAQLTLDALALGQVEHEGAAAGGAAGAVANRGEVEQHREAAAVAGDLCGFEGAVTGLVHLDDVAAELVEESSEEGLARDEPEGGAPRLACSEGRRRGHRGEPAR